MGNLLRKLPLGCITPTIFLLLLCLIQTLIRRRDCNWTSVDYKNSPCQGRAKNLVWLCYQDYLQWKMGYALEEAFTKGRDTKGQGQVNRWMNIRQVQTKAKQNRWWVHQGDTNNSEDTKNLKVFVIQLRSQEIDIQNIV